MTVNTKKVQAKGISSAKMEDIVAKVVRETKPDKKKMETYKTKQAYLVGQLYRQEPAGA